MLKLPKKRLLSSAESVTVISKQAKTSCVLLGYSFILNCFGVAVKKYGEGIFPINDLNALLLRMSTVSSCADGH